MTDMPEILGINGTPYRINSSYIELQDRHEALTAIAEKMAVALEVIAKRPSLPHPERAADWKNCMKWSAYEAQQALTEYNKYKGE